MTVSGTFINWFLTLRRRHSYIVQVNSKRDGRRKREQKKRKRAVRIRSTRIARRSIQLCMILYRTKAHYYRKSTLYASKLYGLLAHIYWMRVAIFEVLASSSLSSVRTGGWGEVKNVAGTIPRKAVMISRKIEAAWTVIIKLSALSNYPGKSEEDQQHACITALHV